MSKPRLTLAEREQVVEEAISLIKEPANWVTGKWKCELYETDKKGNIVYDENRQPIPVRDLYNRPQAQYCIEGAVHEAMHRVVGSDRAQRMGAYFEDGDCCEIWPTDILGIDALAREKYPEICEDEAHAAMVLNDYHVGRKSKLGHGRILGLLQDTLDQIKAKKR